jgi:uncharacterized protein (TIGR02145 family)
MNRNEQQYANVGAGFKPALFAAMVATNQTSPQNIATSHCRGHFTKKGNQTLRKGNHAGLPLLLLIVLLLALNAFAQQTTVAVLPSEGASLNNDELEALTDKMRGAALKVLPASGFVLLKQDVVVKRLGGAENYIKECSESSCIVDLGKKAQVDYVAQASVGKLGGKMRLKVELYNVRTEGLVGIFDGGGFFDGYFALLESVDKNVPEVFSKIPGASGGKAPSPSFAGGIGGVQTAGGDYEFEGGKSYVASIATEPEGAVLSFNGVPDSRCAKTPCKIVLAEGNARIIANLEQYEIADTTVFIKQNNQNINIRLKANFGVLEIKPAYSDGIGKNERWSLAINGKAVSYFENRLSPNKYKVELSHRCYEALSFDAGINKDKREVFDMASHVKLKKGGLVLNVERNGEPVSEPVYVNGKREGETPFSGSVPICAEIEIGSNREKVDVKLKYNERVEHTVKSSGGVSGGAFTDSRDKKKYKAIKIGTQTWMAENLNYNVSGSKCYNNKPANCDKYGRLYNWSTAMKACPKGWHLPSDAEWTALTNYVESNSGCSKCAGKHLKSASGWDSYSGISNLDTYGFSALPGGLGDSGGSFRSVGIGGYWWSSSESGSDDAYFRYMYYDIEYAYYFNYVKSNLYSVRCLKD